MLTCIRRLGISLYVPSRHLSLSLSRAQRAHTPEFVDARIDKGKNNLNIDQVRLLDLEVETCNYPLLERMGISTDGKQHKISFSCDEAVKYICMGLVNKNLALQYCYYLVELIKNGEKELHQYYGKRALHILSYLTNNREGILNSNLSQLSCEIADSSPSNCTVICERFLVRTDLNITPRQYSKLLASCYNFGLWTQADQLMKKYSSTLRINVYLFDQMVSGLCKLASTYKSDELDTARRYKLRKEFLNHFFNFIEESFKQRVQLITKNKAGLRQSLGSLDIKVTINPKIKPQSGRCTHCGTSLPLYDSSTTSFINQSIKKVIDEKVFEDQNLFTTQNEISHFGDFLQSIYDIDKRPLDCVIDGLNTSYSSTRGSFLVKKRVSDDLERTILRHDQNAQVQVLINTILRGKFLTDFKKVLVIGRKHMERWPGLMDFFKTHKIFYYSSANLSKDDLFALYAATLSPNTFLVTNDFLRDHLALLDGSARHHLERWIDTHQVWVDRKSLTPIKATRFEKLPSIDRDKKRFHLPVVDFNQIEDIADHAPPPHLNGKMLTWLCCELGNSEEIEDSNVQLDKKPC